MSPTASARAPTTHEALLPTLHGAADDLVAAVHALDPLGVAAALNRAGADYPGDDTLAALVVLLAGAVAEDAPMSELVCWVDDPLAYRRMRTVAGMSPASACSALADALHRQEPRDA